MKKMIQIRHSLLRGRAKRLERIGVVWFKRAKQESDLKAEQWDMQEGERYCNKARELRMKARKLRYDI